MMTEPHDLLDRSLKVLTRRAAPALLRLAEVAADPAQVRFEDTAVNVPEHRADTIMLIGAEEDPARWGWHVEYQLEPDARVISGWLFKNALFNRSFSLPVILTVVYLARGDRATFPDRHWIQGGGLTNDHGFHTLRLWEYAEPIRRGELPELAPLLVLCEDKPVQSTLRRERELILGLEASPAVKADLLAVAVMVGTRFFAREVLERLFRREMTMLKEAGFIQEWIEEGMAEGEARGEALGSRRVLLRQLRERFGELPEAVVERIEQADPAECEEWAVRLLHASSLEEIGFFENGSPASEPDPE